MIKIFPSDLYTTSRRPKPFTQSPIPHPYIVPDFQADKFSATNMMVPVCVISSSLCSGSQLYRQLLPLRYRKGRERWLLSSTCVVLVRVHLKLTSASVLTSFFLPPGHYLETPLLRLCCKDKPMTGRNLSSLAYGDGV